MISVFKVLQEGPRRKISYDIDYLFTNTETMSSS